MVVRDQGKNVVEMGFDAAGEKTHSSFSCLRVLSVHKNDDNNVIPNVPLALQLQKETV